MSKSSLIAIISLAVSLSTLTQAATYGGGSGTAENPYQIWTPQQMNTIGANSSDWGKHFKLMADIDMSIYIGTQYNIIGNWTTEFTGTFDGNGYVISNLTGRGLFGYTNGAVIQNLGLENVSISSSGYTGSLVRYAKYTTVTACWATGSVTSEDEVGGLVGRNDFGSIINCFSTCDVYGNDTVGGLVGYNDGVLSNSYATGSVTGGKYSGPVGGLVGWNGRDDFTSISNCYATGAVSGDDMVGGLIGYNLSPVTSCYSTGSVSGDTKVGGLVGANSTDPMTSCYSTGSVNGISDVGGLIGYQYSGVLPSLCFWNTQTSGQSTSAGGTGKTTSEMMTQNTFVDWDFSDNDGDPADWMMLHEGEDYPRLAWQEIFAGDIAGLYGVNMVDFSELARNWHKQGCPAGCEQADIDNSGVVNLGDLIILAADWLK